MVPATGREIIKQGYDSKNLLWFLEVKHGEFIVHIVHPIKEIFCFIRLDTRYSLEESELTILEEICKDPKKQYIFRHGLIASLASPITSFRVHYTKTSNGIEIPIGFFTEAKLFPLEANFSVDKLDKAIQSVVSAGNLGRAFFASTLQVSETSLGRQDDPTSSPDGMYL
jgi:hypothetical protein